MNRKQRRERQRRLEHRKLKRLVASLPLLMCSYSMDGRLCSYGDGKVYQTHAVGKEGVG